MRFYKTCKAVTNIADSGQSSLTPGGSRQISGNIKQKATDTKLNNTTSHHKHLYEISTLIAVVPEKSLTKFHMHNIGERERRKTEKKKLQ